MRRSSLPWLKIALAALSTAELAFAQTSNKESSKSSKPNPATSSTTTTSIDERTDTINTIESEGLPVHWPYSRWLPIGICEKYKLCEDCNTCGLEINDEWLDIFYKEVLRINSGEHCTGLSAHALPKTNTTIPTIRIGVRPWETSMIVGGMAQIILEELLNLNVSIVSLHNTELDDSNSSLTVADEAEAWWTSTKQAISEEHIDLEVESWDALSAADWSLPRLRRSHSSLGSTGYRGQAGIFVSPHLIKVLEEEESHVTSDWRAAVEWFQWLRGTPTISMPQEVIDAIYRHMPIFGETLELAGIGDEHVVKRVPAPACVACNNLCCAEVFLRAHKSPSGAGVPATRLQSIMLAWDLRIVLTYLDDEDYYSLTAEGAEVSFLTWAWYPHGTFYTSVRVQFMYDGMLASQGMSEVFDWPAFSLLKIGNAKIMNEYPVLAMVIEKLIVRREALGWELHEYLTALIVVVFGGDPDELSGLITKVGNCIAMRASQDTELLPYWANAIWNCRDLKSEVVDGACSSSCLEGGYLSNSKCLPCPVGYYCPTAETIEKCPNGTTTNGEGKITIGDCMCEQGKEVLFDPSDPDGSKPVQCVDCPKGLYKNTVDNAPCHQSCPPNAFMDITGAENDMYCSCREGFYLATLYGSQRCISCPDGAVCAGGFNLQSWTTVEEILAVIRKGGPDLWKVHTPPIAASGYFGLHLTLPDDISAEYQPTFVTCVKDSFACEGNNKCTEGSSGERCFICLKGWVRGQSPQCQECPSDTRNLLATVLSVCILQVMYIQVVRLVRWAARHYNVLSPMIIKIIINYFQSLNAVFVITKASSTMSAEAAGWVSWISRIIVGLANLSNAVGLARQQLLCSTHTVLKAFYFGEERYQEFQNEEWELILTNVFFYVTALAPILTPIFLTTVTFVVSLIYDIPRPRWRSRVVKKITSCRAMQEHVAKQQPHCKAAIELLEDHISDLELHVSRFWLWIPLRLARAQKPEMAKRVEYAADADDESEGYDQALAEHSLAKRSKLKKGLSNATGIVHAALTNIFHNMLSIWTLFWFWIYYSTICGLLQLTCYCINLDYMGTMQYRLMMCPQLTCFEGDHEKMMITGVSFLVLHGSALPLFIRTLVRWKRRYGVDITYGLNTNGYDHSGTITMYWDVVFLVRSFIVSFIEYFRTKDMLEVVPRTFLMVYLLVSLALQSFYRPFDVRRDGILNVLEGLSLLLLSVSVPVFEVIVENPSKLSHRIAWVCGLFIHLIFVARCIRQLMRDGVNTVDAIMYTRLYEAEHRRKRLRSKQREREFLNSILVSNKGQTTTAEETAADDKSKAVAKKMPGTKVGHLHVGLSAGDSSKLKSLEHERKEASKSQQLKDKKEKSSNEFALGQSALGASAVRALQQGAGLTEAALGGMQKSLKNLSELKEKVQTMFEEELQQFESDSSTSSEGSSSGFSESTSSFSGDSEIIVLEQQIPSRQKQSKVSQAQHSLREFKDRRLVPFFKANTPELIMSSIRHCRNWKSYVKGSRFSSMMRTTYHSVALAVKPHISNPVVRPKKSGFEFSGAAHKLSTGAQSRLEAMSIQLKIQRENSAIVGALHQIFRCVIRGHKLHTIPLGMLKHITTNREVIDHPRVYLAYGGRKAVGMACQIQKMGIIVDSLIGGAEGDDPAQDYMYNLMALNDAMERVLKPSARGNREVNTRILEFTALNWQNRAASSVRKNLNNSSWFRARPPTMDREDHAAVEPHLCSKANLRAPSELELPRSSVEAQEAAAISAYTNGFMRDQRAPRFWDLHVSQAIGLDDMEGMENAHGSSFLRQSSADAFSDGKSELSFTDGKSELSRSVKTISKEHKRALSRGGASMRSTLSLEVDHLHDLRSATHQVTGKDDEDEINELSSEDIRELVDHSSFIDSRARFALKLLVPEAALLILDKLSASVDEAKGSMKNWLASLAVSTLRSVKVEPLVRDESELDLVFRQFKKTLPILGLRESDCLVYQLGERLNRVLMHHSWEASHREWLMGIMNKHMRYLSLRWTEIGIPILSSEEMAILKFYDSSKVFSANLKEISKEWGTYEPPASDLKAWQTWHALRRHMMAVLSLSDTVPQASGSTLFTQQRNTLLDNAHAALRGVVKKPGGAKANRQQRMQAIVTEETLVDEEDLQILQSLSAVAKQEAQQTFFLALEEWRHRCMDWAFGVADTMLRVPICSVTKRENAYVHEREDYQHTKLNPWSARQSSSILQDNVLRNSARILIKSEHYPQLYLASPLEDSSEVQAVVTPQGELQRAQGHMGIWLIQKVHETGHAIMHGDEVFLTNRYGSGSFLDAREQDLEGGAIWCVSAEHHSRSGRQADSFIISNKKGHGPIHFDQEVMLANVDAKQPAYIAAEPPARHPFKKLATGMSELTTFPISTTLHSPSALGENQRAYAGFKGYWLLSPADSRFYDFKCYKCLFAGPEVPPGVGAALCTRGSHTYSEVEPTHTGSQLTQSSGKEADTWQCCICQTVSDTPKADDDYHTFSKHWWCEGCDLSFCQKCYKLLSQWERLQKMAEGLGKQVAVVQCANCKKTWDWEDIEYNSIDTCDKCGNQLKFKAKTSHAQHSFTNLQRLVKNKRHILVDLLLKLDGSLETYLMSPVGTFTGRDVIHWFAIQVRKNAGSMFKNKFCSQGFHQMEELTMSAEADPVFKCKSCGHRTLRYRQRKDDARSLKDFSWRKRVDRLECVSCSNCMEMYCPRCRQVMDAVVDIWEVIDRCGKMDVLDGSAVLLLKTVTNDCPGAVLDVLLELENKADWERELRCRQSAGNSGGQNYHIYMDTVSRWAERRLQELCGEDYMNATLGYIFNAPSKPEIQRIHSKVDIVRTPSPLHLRSTSTLSVSLHMGSSEEVTSGRLSRGRTGVSSVPSNVTHSYTGNGSRLTGEGNQYSIQTYFKPPEACDIMKASKGVGTDPEDAGILKEVEHGKRDPASLELRMHDDWVHGKEMVATAWGDHKIELQKHVERKTQHRSNYAEMGVQVEFGTSDALAVVQAKLEKRDGPSNVQAILPEDRYRIRAEDAAKASVKEKKTEEQLQMMQDLVTHSHEILAKAVSMKHTSHRKPSHKTKHEMLQMLHEVKDLQAQRRMLTESKD